MDWSQVIGFIISVLALAFLILRNAWQERSRQQNPEEYARNEKNREKRLKDLLRTMDIEIEDEEEEEPQTPPQPPPRPIQKPAPRFSQQPIKIPPTKKTAAENYPGIVTRRSRGKKMLQNISPKEMVILSELYQRKY